MCPSTSNLQPKRALGAILAALILGLLAFAYSNSLQAPFVFDDFGAIADNPSIRDLSRLSQVLNPPSDTGLTVNGRPLVNLSLALNYHFAGTRPQAYHLTNIGLHLATSVLLFLILHSLFKDRSPRPAPPPQSPASTSSASPLQPASSILPPSAFSLPPALPALALAGLWALHPLHTAAVTYVVQRAEVLVSLLACGTVYLFLNYNRQASRSAGSLTTRLLGAACVLTCLAGMATKEVMAGIPLLLLLLDRALNQRSFLATLRRRPFLYSGLAATWLLLGWLVLSGGARGHTAGFSVGISPWDYFRTQWYAIPHYLRLALWPDQLLFDYGGKVLVSDWSRLLPGLLVLLCLAALCLWALVRRPLLGAALAAFFLLLAPSSSFMPLIDTIFEHRIYLALAALLCALACVLPGAWHRPATYLALALLPLLAFLTQQRNETYRSERSLWEDVLAKNPSNVRAHYTLGMLLYGDGEREQAIAHYQSALSLDPANADTRINLGAALSRMGRNAEAAEQLTEALRTKPNSVFAHNNLANALAALGRASEAITHYEAALALYPNSSDTHNNLGSLLASLHRWPEAEEHLRQAIRLNVRFADAHANLANILAQTGRQEESLKHYTAALTFRPKFVDAWFNRATTYALMGRYAEAIADYKAVLTLDPGHANAREMLRRLGSSR